MRRWWLAMFLLLPLRAASANEALWVSQLSDEATRQEATWQLRLSKNPEFRPQMLELLGHQDPRMRLSGLQILAEGTDSSVWESIVPLLQDGDPRVREEAARSLGTLGEPGAIPFLVKSIVQEMDMSDALTYWALPSDITHNHRYVAVDALNRLANQKFGYTRALNNFGRAYWVSRIRQWWVQQERFTQGDFANEAETWQALKNQLEKLLARVPSDSMGGDELAMHLGKLKEDLEIVLRNTQAPSVSTSELRESDQRMDALMPIDEVFVFSPEISELQGDWEAFKEELSAARAGLKQFLDKP